METLISKVGDGSTCSNIEITLDEDNLPLQITDQSQDGGSVEFRVDQGEFSANAQKQKQEHNVSFIVSNPYVLLPLQIVL